MKVLIYILSLVLSLPNLVAGMALLILRHTFATRNPIEIVFSFLFQVFWGIPMVAALVLLLLVLGCIRVTRAHAALFALVLSAVALGFVLYRVGPPPDMEAALFFIPVLLAMVGFGRLVFSKS